MECAKNLCKKGIEAKFVQNPQAMQALLETGSKQLVESACDGLWGTGVPIHQTDCLNHRSWKTQGILGEILQEIHQFHMEQARSLLPMVNPWFQTQSGPQLGNMPINAGTNTMSSGIGPSQGPNPQQPLIRPVAPLLATSPTPTKGVFLYQLPTAKQPIRPITATLAMPSPTNNPISSNLPDNVQSPGQTMDVS